DPEGRRRGFGFVTLQDEDAARRASETLDGSSFRGRSLGVNLARRGGSGSGGAGGGGSAHAGAPHGSAPRPRFRGPDSPMSDAPPAGGVGEPPKDDDWRAKKERRKDKKKKGRSLVPERPGAPKQ